MNKLIIILLLASNAVFADVPAVQVKEVSHLIGFIRNSGCSINRNGTDHSAEKGIHHIEKKYDYYRDDIKSTEDFIELSASKSTMSGDYYTVKCSGKESIKTQDWLLTELKLFRSKQYLPRLLRETFFSVDENMSENGTSFIFAD